MKLGINERLKGKRLYKEVWKPVKDTQNYYVSNMGRVKRIYKSGKERILVGRVHYINGYVSVTICENGKQRDARVHRLVAEAFIPNPDNKEFVDHINTNKTDNRVINLRWATRDENANNELTRQHLSEAHKGTHHSEETKQKLREINTGKKMTDEQKQKLSEARKGKYSGEEHYMFGKHLSEEHKDKLRRLNSKKCRCIETGIIYSSTKEAKIQTGICDTCIQKCCKGQQKTAGGYHWEYVTEEGDN